MPRVITEFDWPTFVRTLRSERCWDSRKKLREFGGQLSVAGGLLDPVSVRLKKVEYRDAFPQQCARHVAASRHHPCNLCIALELEQTGRAALLRSLQRLAEREPQWRDLTLRIRSALIL